MMVCGKEAAYRYRNLRDLRTFARQLTDDCWMKSVVTDDGARTILYLRRNSPLLKWLGLSGRGTRCKLLRQRLGGWKRLSASQGLGGNADSFVGATDAASGDFLSHTAKTSRHQR